MMFTKDEPPDEVLESRGAEKDLFLLACNGCADRSLDYTGGICPITSCAKSLLNGQCGGAHEGKCEVGTEKDCRWIIIYEQSRRIDRLENLRKVLKPRDHSKMMPSAELRKISFYDVDE